jgi:hypothetical protein
MLPRRGSPNLDSNEDRKVAFLPTVVGEKPHDDLRLVTAGTGVAGVSDSLARGEIHDAKVESPLPMATARRTGSSALGSYARRPILGRAESAGRVL